MKETAVADGASVPPSPRPPRVRRIGLAASWAPRVDLAGLPGDVRARLKSEWRWACVGSPRRWAAIGAWYAMVMLPAMLLVAFVRQLPHRPIATGLAVLLMAGGQLLLYVGLVLPRRRFLFRRVRELGFCTGCGYDVRAQEPGGRCPECGTVREAAETAA